MGFRILKTEADLQCLFEVQEDKYLEYKELPPTNDPEDKKEFLADVSAFANAGGGTIIYGAEEQRGPDRKATGFPAAFNGIPAAEADGQIRRLENLIRDGIRPRIPGVSFEPPIPLANGNVVLVLQIPKSWAAPHVVDYMNRWRFYSRNSAGKYPLDVAEVRGAFLQAELTSQQVSAFRIDRLAKIVAGETPVSLQDGAKTVLHLIPLNSFDPTVRYDLSGISAMRLCPIFPMTWDYRLNFDGAVSYSGGLADARGYLQVFRNGKIEAADTRLLTAEVEGMRCVPAEGFEKALVEAYERYIKILRSLEVPAPIVVCLSLLGVKGYFLFHGDVPEDRIDRDDLLMPEVIVEDLAEESSRVLKPLFDLLWNAAGLPRSRFYDANGRWLLR